MGYEKDGKCNIDIGTIKEKTEEEIKKEYGFDQKSEVIPITKEEVMLGDEALEEILKDLDEGKNFKKDDDNESSRTNKSTEMDESNKSYFSSGFEDPQNQNQTGIKIFEDDDDDWEEFYENDISKLDYIKSKNEKLINEIAIEMKKKSKPKGNEKNDSKTNKNYSSNINEKTSKREREILAALDDLVEGVPEYEQLKLELIFELVHIKSKEIIEYNKKNGTNITTVELFGFKYPLDYSHNFGTYEEVLEQIKKDFGIPEYVKPIEQSSKNNQERFNTESKLLIFKWIENGVEKTVIIRNDFHGHVFEKGYEIISHFNIEGDPMKRHYFYRGKRKWQKKENNFKKKKK